MSVLGWLVAAVLLMRVRELGRRLELVARAEHELRGPLGALGLIAAAAGRVKVDWRAGPVAIRADRRRLAQLFGNLLQNAVEHGGGEVALRATRGTAGVVVEIVDGGPGFKPRRLARGRRAQGRGRGLGIATAAAEEAGGRLRLIEGGRGAKVAVELPAADR